MLFKETGSKTQYSFLDKSCIGRLCWAPGEFQHRVPLAGGGSMNTSSPPTPCCLNRAYRGCPEGPIGEYVSIEDGIDIHHIGSPASYPELASKRKQQGWKAVR